MHRSNVPCRICEFRQLNDDICSKSISNFEDQIKIVLRKRISVFISLNFVWIRALDVY
jgi:hypothetical protein